MIKKNICGTSSNKVPREAISGTMHRYPVLDNGQLYGAVIEGYRRSSNTSPGKPKMATKRALYDVANFGSWRKEMSRALRYLDAPIQTEAKLAEMTAAQRSINLRIGQYTAHDIPVLTVRP